MPVSSYALLSLPYAVHSTPSVIVNDNRIKAQRFDPYISSIDSNARSTPQPTATRRVSRKRIARPTAVAAAATGPIAEKHPNEDYGEYDPSRVLYEDGTLKTHTAKKVQFWFYVLSLLMDPSKKNVISWTGRGTEFVVTNPDAFISLWSINQGKIDNVKEDTIRRNFNACCKRRIMMPVSVQKSQYAFITQPSIHLDSSSEELMDFIANNCLNGTSTQSENKIEDCIYPTPPPTDYSYEYAPSPPPVSHSDSVAPSHSSEVNSFFNDGPHNSLPNLYLDSQPFRNLPILIDNSQNYTDSNWNLSDFAKPESAAPAQNQSFNPAHIKPKFIESNQHQLSTSDPVKQDYVVPSQYRNPIGLEFFQFP